MPRTCRPRRFARPLPGRPQDALLMAGNGSRQSAYCRPSYERRSPVAGPGDAALEPVVRALPGRARYMAGRRWSAAVGVASGGGCRWPAPIWVRRPGCCSTNRARGWDADVAAEVARRLDARLRRTGQGMILVSHRPVTDRAVRAAIRGGRRVPPFRCLTWPTMMARRVQSIRRTPRWPDRVIRPSCGRRSSGG